MVIYMYILLLTAFLVQLLLLYCSTICQMTYITSDRITISYFICTLYVFLFFLPLEADVVEHALCKNKVVILS